ncbi:MAG TPA: hypothetical protein VHE35_34265 [Kofleriaceae bacterium]|nr:hypothetical protein [Kofleriaceae bacterium]
MLLGTAALATSAGVAHAATTVSSRDSDLYGACVRLGSGPATSGEVIDDHERVITASDKAVLVYQSDGNLVLYGLNSSGAKTPIWSSQTGSPGTWTQMCMNTNGGVTVTNLTTGTTWSRTSSYGGSDAQLQIDDGCHVKALRGDGTTIWEVQGMCPSSDQVTQVNGWRLLDSQEVTLAESDWATLKWSGGRLSVYATGIDDGELIWSATTTPGAWLNFQNDGNAVIYSATGGVVWASNTSGSKSSHYLIGLDHCAMKIDRFETGTQLYSSGSSCPQSSEPNLVGQYVNWNDGDVLLENDVAQLVLTGGKLVLRTRAGDTLWTTENSGAATVAAFKPDGNLEIRGATGIVQWSTSTSTGTTSKLVLDGCKFSIVNPAGAEVFSRGFTDCNLASRPFDDTSVANNGSLRLLQTGDAYLEYNGNLHLKTTGGTTLWETGVGDGRYLDLQGDGNLVIYGASGPLWATGTNGAGTKTLQLDGCTLTLRNAAGGVISTLNSSCNVAVYAYENAQGNSRFGVVMDSTMTVVGGTSPRTTSVTSVGTTVFGHDTDLYSATVTKRGTTTSVTPSVSFLGNTLDVSGTLAVDLADEQKTFMVGVVPVTVSAGLSGSVGLAMSVSSDTVTMEPSVDLTADVTAGVGAEDELGGATAGVKGSLTLIHAGLPISMRVYPSGFTWKYDVTGQLTIETLSGSLSLFAEAFVKFAGFSASMEYSYKLFSWTGLSWTKTLFSNTGHF